MKAIRTSETSVPFNEIIWRYITEGYHLQVNLVFFTQPTYSDEITRDKSLKCSPNRKKYTNEWRLEAKK
jgi:hypothetical protein